jgi:hypothetical protein
MAEQAERICAVCGNPMDLPRQSASIEDLLCSKCKHVRRRGRSIEDRLEADFGVQELDRPDFDLHPPGVM